MAWFDKCITLLGCIIEVFLIYDYFHNFFELRIKKKCIKFVFTIICGLLFGFNLLGNATINLFAFPLLLWIFVSVIFDSKIGVRIGYFLSAYIVMIAVEFLFLILSSTTSEMLKQTGIIPINDYGWLALFSKFINFIVFLLLKQTSKKSHSHMKNKLFFTYLCVPVSSLGIMLTIYYSGVDFSKHVAVRVVMTLFFVFMIAGNMLLFYSFQKHTEEMSEASRQQLELFYKNAEIKRLTKITEMNDNYNETVHNMTHSLKVIEQLAIENSVADIQEIVEMLTGKLTQKDIYEYCNHKMLNAILSEYKEKSEILNIKFDVYVEPGCVLTRIKDIDLVSMVGNILDNAFEAAGKASDSSIVFRIFMHEKGKMCIIKVVNDYECEIVEKNGKIITTKKEGGIHGIGIASIAKTAEQYEGSFSYYTKDKKFYAVLILPVC